MLNRSQFQKIRFRLDDPSEYGLNTNTCSPGDRAVKTRFLSRHVQISPQLFPQLYDDITRVASLLLDTKKVTAFVSADESMNAACVFNEEMEPLIWLSSGLVKSLAPQELAFVVGHELGHWLLGHDRYPLVNPDEGPRFLARQQLSRAAEISSDRIGLIACGDLDHALRAILKTASGLDDRYLGARTSDFISQLSEIDPNTIDVSEEYASHPPMTLRARALLWFSMSDIYLGLQGDATAATKVSIVDDKIEKDLTSFLGTEYQRKQAKDISDALLWISLYEMIVDGILSKDDQAIIETEFGKTELERVRQFLQGKSKEMVVKEIRDRAMIAKDTISAYPRHIFDNALESSLPLKKFAQTFFNKTI